MIIFQVPCSECHATCAALVNFDISLTPPDLLLLGYADFRKAGLTPAYPGSCDVFLFFYPVVLLDSFGFLSKAKKRGSGGF